MQVGDLAVLLHLPVYGRWSIVRVSGTYRFEISPMPNAVDGAPDYGHIRDVELLTGEFGIDSHNGRVGDDLRSSLRNRQRMWSLDAHGEEIVRLLAQTGPR